MPSKIIQEYSRKWSILRNLAWPGYTKCWNNLRSM